MKEKASIRTEVQKSEKIAEQERSQKACGTGCDGTEMRYTYGAGISEGTAVWKRLDLRPGYRAEKEERASSGYLIARKDSAEEYQKELLYRLLGPVFFGEKAAGNLAELIALFREKYGIDVKADFCEGDEHYEEYLEAREAIAEGMSIYGGAIAFDESVMAELAEMVWECMEKEEGDGFRRINTMLEE